MMSEIEKIVQAVKKHPEDMNAVQAAFDIFAAAITGNTKHVEAKYASWLELDQACEDVKIGQLQSSSLINLFKFALSFVIRATRQRR